MACYTFLYAAVLTFVVASSTRMMASPEPEMDPMGGPGMAVVSAGDAMRPMKVLKKFNKICPSDYPTGFSIRCFGESSGRARFFVNGKLMKVEYRDPYYIAGDFKGRVRPWNDYPRKAKILCKLARRTKVYAKIKFAC